MKLSRPMTGLLAVALMSFMVSDVMAQGRRPGGGGPGGFGQRGPGGGGFGGRGGPGGMSVDDLSFGLLRIDEVKVEIELSPDQDEAVGKMMQPPADRGGRPQQDFRQMSDSEREEFFANMRKERDERNAKRKEQLEEILLPQQMDRLREIAVQQLGVRALDDESIAKELKITEAQTKKLDEVGEKVREENGAKMRELFQSGDRDAMREAFTKMREETEKQTLAVLTSDQRKQFEDMKGKKFDLPEGALFGGGRGGPGGGGFGGRGGRGGDDGGDGSRRRGRPPVEE